MSNNKQKGLTLHQSFIFNPRHYKLFALGLFSFFCAYVVASTLTPVKSSDASTVVINNNTSDFFIQITSADSLGLDVTASPTGQMAIAKDTINVVTNSPNGYKLYVSTSGNDNNIYQGGSSSSASEGYFQPGSGTISSPAKLTQNTWGFALDSSTGDPFSANFANIDYYSTGNPSADSTWAEVPKYANSSNAKIAETSDYNSPDGTDLDIFYGINASTTLPTGSYSTEVTYTAISEGVNIFPTMQDFTSAQCDAMGTNTSINLSDSRDDKYYRVTKMADGHCWMTDNLALDGTDKAGNVRVLAPADSNVTTSRTLAANVPSGTPQSTEDIQIYSGVSNNTTSQCDTVTYPYCIVNTSTKYGNLYNWSAATAGVGKVATGGTVIESICPKGWRLPDDTGDFSYANLMSKYNLPTAATTDGTAVQAMQQSPLFYANIGYFDAVPISQGYNAIYWTRTAYDPNLYNAKTFSYGTNGGIGYNPINKYIGSGIRCIFGGQSDEIMQNFTATQCANLAESTAEVDNRKTMIDSRDGKFYTISKLADGNCWMTSNLALDGMDGLGTVRTLTTADSNVTQNRTLATNIPDNTVSTNTEIQIYSGNALSMDSNGIKAGNSYNFMAATAGIGTSSITGTIMESICSKNWRLPDNAGDLSFVNLMSKYSLPTTNVSDAAAAVSKVQKEPLYTSLSGYYLSKGAQEYGSSGVYWSRIVPTDNSYSAYLMDFNSSRSTFWPLTLNQKIIGISVRCVFGS